MNIKNNIKKLLEKLKIKYPYYHDEELFFDIQYFKKNFDNTNNDKTIKFENFLLYILKKNSYSKSQIYQDLLVDFILDKDKGFFCEIGACDGIVHSNSYYLEKERNWKGILCEPASFWLEKLKTNRSDAIIETRPLFSKTNIPIEFVEKPGGRSFIDLNNSNMVDKKVKISISLNDLLKNNKISKIDYLSIDTEGSEFEILNTFDLNLYRPKIITVEHNYKDYRKDICSLLTKKKYKRIFKSISRFDDWYIHRSIIQ